MRKALKKDSGAPCPIMHGCGGCEWLGLPYRKQLARKHAAMVELYTPLIERFGWDVAVEAVVGMGTHAVGAGASAIETCTPTRSPRGFRHKAATPFAPGPEGEVVGGFFARGTHDIVACPTCAVEAPGAREILNEVASIATELGIPAYDEDRRRGELRYAILRTGWRTGECMITLVTRGRDVAHLDELAHRLMQAHPEIVTVAHNVNPRVTNAILGGETSIIAGRDRMRDQLLGCTFEISPVSFYQVNPEQTEVLYARAIEAAKLRSNDVLLDTYCGSGTIGLCAAAKVREAGIDVNLIGVERNAEGIRDAKRNAALNGLDSASRFIARDATEYMLEAAEANETVDILIMDPPRAGSTPEFIRAAATLGPRTVIYISCNPTTQARDLELFAHEGYDVTTLVPVDLFPHTSHTEMIAALHRCP